MGLLDLEKVSLLDLERVLCNFIVGFFAEVACWRDGVVNIVYTSHGERKKMLALILLVRS